MTGEQKPGGLEVVGWIKRTNENHPIGMTQPSDWRFSPHEPLLSEGSKAEWFDQFRVTPAEPAEARIRELERQLCIVQNAATTLHHCRDTELQHLRENATFDHRLRAEHESLMERDATMTDLLEQAEARATAAEAKLARAVEAGRRQADNMAFVLIHAEVGTWYEKFTAELAEDRTALEGASDDR